MKASTTYLTVVEWQREATVLGQPCPVCGVEPRRACRFPGGYSMTSHAGRYLLAVDAGLVPEFAGGWRG